MMPNPTARPKLLTKHLDADEGEVGKIIKEGDGVSSSIVYQLGTPIPVTGKNPITELEFLASTYGDIEDVMSANDSIAQTALLIAAIGKPPGMSGIHQGCECCLHCCGWCYNQAKLVIDFLNRKTSRRTSRRISLLFRFCWRR